MQSLQSPRAADPLSLRAEVCFGAVAGHDDPMNLPSDPAAQWHELDLSIDPPERTLAIEGIVIPLTPTSPPFSPLREASMS